MMTELQVQSCALRARRFPMPQGAFCAALASGFPLHACLQRASTAGTAACGAVGARAGVPSAAQLSERVDAAPPGVIGNWGPGGTPGAACLEAPGLSWGRQR